MAITGAEVNLEGNVYIIYSSYDDNYYLEDRDPDNWRTSEECWDTFQEAEHAYEANMFEWEQEDLDPSDCCTYADKVHDQGYRRSEQLARWEY